MLCGSAGKLKGGRPWFVAVLLNAKSPACAGLINLDAIVLSDMLRFLIRFARYSCYGLLSSTETLDGQFIFKRTI